jgi:hypothetical protein
VVCYNPSMEQKLSTEKRMEERAPSYQVGRYLQSLDGITCRLGTFRTLNESRKGVLLQTSDSFSTGEVLEVSFDKASKPSETILVEVCWSKAVSLQADSEQRVVGCRRLITLESPT